MLYNVIRFIKDFETFSLLRARRILIWKINKHIVFFHSITIQKRMIALLLRLQLWKNSISIHTSTAPIALAETGLPSLTEFSN